MLTFLQVFVNTKMDKLLKDEVEEVLKKINEV